MKRSFLKKEFNIRSILLQAGILLFAFTLLSDTILAQDENIWKTLAKVAYKKEYNELLGFKVDVPVFSPEIKALDGEEITVRGYVIPTEGFKSHKEFVFSAFPYNMCYFCGGAGPETVMEVEAVEAVKFTSDPIVLRGILQLNAKDINRLMYKIIEAKQLDEGALN
jgi:hypothetical protein